MKSKLSTTKPDPDLARWCAALASNTVTDEVPIGWHTLRQLATTLGKAESTIGAQLSRAVREGRAETQSFRIHAGKMVRPVPHYRLK